jgi:hypothetical protein
MGFEMFVTQKVQMALAQLVLPWGIMPFKQEGGQFYGDLRVHLEHQGTPIG